MSFSIKEHLKSRYMNLSVHVHWLDEENCKVTFPITTLLGQMVGYQRYSPLHNKKKNNDPTDCRYYTFRNKESTYGVWGLESWRFSRTLFLTEGIFDACRLTNLGYSAIATLSNNPKHLKNWVYIISQMRPIVVVCDPDKAGIPLRKYGTYYHTMKETDLGDTSDEEVYELIERWKNI